MEGLRADSQAILVRMAKIDTHVKMKILTNKKQANIHTEVVHTVENFNLLNVEEIFSNSLSLTN